MTQKSKTLIKKSKIDPKNNIQGTQNAFHNKLTRYINGGIFSHSDLFFSFFVPGLTFKKYSEEIIRKFKEFTDKIPAQTNADIHVEIESYKGRNRHVIQMSEFLKENLKKDLVGAYLHGSLASYEEIPYSDFDALVILKDELFESPQRLTNTAKKLNQARAIMLDFDPLQHHGWFVLTEADLTYYCNAYFPVELLYHSKSFFDDKGRELEISLRESDFEVYEAFEKISDDIINKTANRQYPKNIYQLKNLLSGFMLLPALYIQARDGKAAYKKDSFDMAKADFLPEDWEIMNIVSKIRADWNYKISTLKKRLMSHPHIISRYYIKKFGLRIPDEIGCSLTDEFYSRINKLTSLMKKELN